VHPTGMVFIVRMAQMRVGSTTNNCVGEQKNRII